ncbi:tetraspanin-9-like [Pectinophora gossypiella]|uniref:tetraspanin-9-like n=1 Tax=Pectinophora gossypiella TaxID=13191 RepID=UPI00214E4552|nr:tetraspanin-9-like [Pectinophora gossypiella]
MRNSGLVLFVCAGLLLSGGAILGGSAGWSVLRMSYHFWASELGAELGAGVQFVAGAMLCLPACWLATLVPHHPRALSLLATLMFLTATAMLMLSSGQGSLAALSRVYHEPALLNASMHRAIARAQYEPAVRNAFASMQLELRCCGVQSASDWYKYRRTLPAACCNRWGQGKRDTCDTPVHTTGCLWPAVIELRYFTNSMSVLSAVMIIILAVTLFATAYSLVSGVIERGELRALKTATALRVACLHAGGGAPAPALLSLVQAPPARPLPHPHPTS